MRKIIFILAALFVTAGAARADYAVLRSGQRLHITGYERAGDMLLLTIEGGVVEVPAQDVVSIEAEDFFPGPPAPSGPYGVVIRAASRKHGVDEDLISSVIAAESNFNPRAVSRKNALGLMQLMPATASRFSAANLFDPAQNVDAGTRYLKQLLEQYRGDLPLALAAYNAGPQRVQRYGGVPPYSETRAYVRRVLTNLQQQKSKSSAFDAVCLSLAFPCSN